MINNYLFRLLFDYRGKISHREYVAGFVLILMCISFGLSNNSIDSLLSAINRYDSNIILTILLQNSFPISIPFNFIALYIALNLSIKRCRAISFSPLIGVVMGLVIYLLLPTIFTSINIKQGMRAIHYGLEGSTNIYFIVASCILLVATLIIFRISYNRYNDYDYSKDEEHEQYQFDSIRCLFYIGSFCIYLIAANILLKYLVMSGMISETRFLFFATSIINIIFFFYICIRRAKDAGINIVIMIATIIGFILLLGGIIYLSFEDRSHAEIYSIILSILVVVYQVGFLIFIGLPSKKLYSEEDITDN